MKQTYRGNDKVLEDKRLFDDLQLLLLDKIDHQVMDTLDEAGTDRKIVDKLLDNVLFHMSVYIDAYVSLELDGQEYLPVLTFTKYNEYEGDHETEALIFPNEMDSSWVHEYAHRMADHLRKEKSKLE